MNQLDTTVEPPPLPIEPAENDVPRISRGSTAVVSAVLCLVPGLPHLLQGRILSAILFGMDIPLLVFYGDIAVR